MCHLIFLDQGKLIPLEKCCTSIYGIGAACVQLCRLSFVDGSVPGLVQLRCQEVIKVVALDLL